MGIETMQTNPERERLLPLIFEMGRLLKSEITRDGVPLPSYLHVETLRFIQERTVSGNAPSMSEIAEYLKIAPPSATALVTTFVKEGILTRGADPEDRRRVRLTLSSEGSDMLASFMKKRDAAYARVFEPLSRHDCEELARIITIITRSKN